LVRREIGSPSQKNRLHRSVSRACALTFLLALLAAGPLLPRGERSVASSGGSQPGPYPAVESPIESSIAGGGSEKARLYLAWLRKFSIPEKREPSAPLPPELALLDRQAASSTFDRDELQALAQSHSIDLATLLFARSILARPENAELQAIFASELARQRERPPSAPERQTSHPMVLFAPGFRYRSNPENGADFAVQREHLTSLGIPNHLIETDEGGSVEENASLLAAELRRRKDDRFMLVSASKAGPEVALALGRLLEPEEARSIAAWINIGGLLAGTPLADQAMKGPRRWLSRIIVWWMDMELETVRSLRTSESRRRLSSLRLPPDLAIVNVVAATLSGDVSKRATGRYRKLREFGPNDGLGLLADQILPGSRTVLLFGEDHFFARHEPRTMALALLATARHAIETPGSNQANQSATVDRDPA
jgi:hypothetical protein